MHGWMALAAAGIVVASCGTPSARPRTEAGAEPSADPPSTPRTIGLPGGRFTMGSPADEEGRDPDEGPTMEVAVSAFAIDVTPVTVAAFEAWAAGRDPGTPPGFSREHETASGWVGRCNLGSARRDHPINCVTWAAARAYCRDHGGDLPTEAEWEYAARAGTTTSYPWGASFDPARAIQSVECGARGCRGATSPVVHEGPRCNAWGVCDVVGNVWQWTLTDYREELGDYVSDVPAATPTNPVHRGGAWLDNVASLFRSAHRGLNYPDHGLTGVGFRCVERRPATHPN